MRLLLIAAELNVDAVIEGSVVTAQLIQAKSDRHLWSESCEHDASDVLALQAEVWREPDGNRLRHFRRRSTT